MKPKTKKKEIMENATVDELAEYLGIDTTTASRLKKLLANAENMTKIITELEIRKDAGEDVTYDRLRAINDQLKAQEAIFELYAKLK